MELQRYIRGSGLAYGAYVGIDLEAGRVAFTLYRVRSGVI
jgi:Zn-dependent M16 (insulinase) family peptidase